MKKVLAIFAVALAAQLTQAQVNPEMTILGPADGDVVNGTIIFKITVEGMSADQYIVTWKVDNDKENLMPTDSSGARKEAIIDVSNWNWRAQGPYPITFTARDTAGTVFSTKLISLKRPVGTTAPNPDSVKFSGLMTWTDLMTAVNQARNGVTLVVSTPRLMTIYDLIAATQAR